MESRTGIRVIKSSRIIPLPPVDWGGDDLRDVALLEITTSEGITGLGSAYTGVNQIRDALALYQQVPETLHTADLQFQATVSDDKFCMVEFRPHRSITDLLKHDPFSLDNEGRISVPTGAGLGVELRGLH